MQPRVDIVRPSTPIGGAATTGSHSAGALARTLLNREKPMRLFTSATFAIDTIGPTRKPRPEILVKSPQVG